MKVSVCIIMQKSVNGQFKWMAKGRTNSIGTLLDRRLINVGSNTFFTT